MQIPHTDIEYPDHLPCVLRAGYDTAAYDTFEETSLASGRSYLTMMFSFVPQDFTLQFLMSDVEAMAFQLWVRDVVKYINWFYITVKTPRSDKDRLLVRFKQGSPTAPKLHSNINKWQITARVQAFEVPLLSDGWGEAPEWLLNASRFDIAMNWIKPEVKEP